MKFLCVACDTPMKLESTTPHEGTLSAVFACPTCAQRIAMLTNPSETQMVQSLGVKIGPGESQEQGASGCPFSGMLSEMQENATVDSVRWTAEALARLENIPDFVRPMARQGVETFAQSRGHAVIDEAVLDEARGKFGM